MAIFLPREYSVDDYDFTLEGDRNANFQELMENKLFRWMLAYPFSWVERTHKAKARHALELIQGRLGDLLDLTQQEFNEEYAETEYEFDEAEFREYKRAFFQTIGSTTIPQVIAALEQEDLLSASVIPRNILYKMKEMDFTMNDLLDNNKTQRMFDAKTTEQGFKPGLPHGARGEGRKEPYGPLAEGVNPEKSAGLMGAFLESRPILYEEIRRHIKVDGHEIKFDTEKYLSEISEAEGFGKLDDSELVVASPRKSSEIEKTVEIFSISNTNDGRYRIEGFDKTRTVDDIEEAWDVYRNATDLEKLEKHIEDTILSQKKSPLSDILYSVVEPDDRMLDVGKLVIHVDQLSQGEKGKAGFGKTEPIGKKSWINWVRALEGKVAETNPNVTKIENLLNYAFPIFNRDGTFSSIDESKHMQKVQSMKDGILEDLTTEDLYDIWEDNGKPDGSDYHLVDDLANAIWRHAKEDDMARGKDGKMGYHREGQFASGVENALEAINADIKSRRAKQDIQGTPTDKPRAEKDKKEVEQRVWIEPTPKEKEEGKKPYWGTKKVPATADRRGKAKSSDRSIGSVGGGGGHSGGGDAFPVLDAGKKKKGMIQLRVSFIPTKLVSARKYEIFTPSRDYEGKTITGKKNRGPLGGKGPKTDTAISGDAAKDKEKDFKTIMGLKLGYNRLKGLVN